MFSWFVHYLPLMGSEALQVDERGLEEVGARGRQEG